MPYSVSYVKVEAPATTANLGPGFDVFGLALDVFHDIVEVKAVSTGAINISVGGVSAAAVPREVDRNTAGVVAKLLLGKAGEKLGLDIRIDKGIPIARGLGSSAACAAATAVALDRVFSLGLSSNELIGVAAQGETASAGTPHADNVSAAILGGFTIIRSYRPLDVVRLEPPPNLEFAVAIPNLPAPMKKTEKARSVIPKTIPLESVTHNVGHASTIVAGFALSRVDLIGKGMADAVVEPARARLIPGYDTVRQRALEAGALGVAISGAGPTMLSLVDPKKLAALKVAEAMKEAFESVGVECETYSAKPAKGARIIELR